MAKNKDRSSPLQQAIQQAIEQRGITRYQLAVQCGWKPSAIYRLLTRPCMARNIERMLAVLGAHVQIDGIKIRLELNDKGVVYAKPNT